MSEKGSTSRLIDEAREEYKGVKNAERDYIAYDLFVQATHANGISYEVIKSMLSRINAEISSVLSTIVDFEVLIEDDGSNLEIYLKHLTMILVLCRWALVPSKLLLWLFALL